jgi:hypothetical protein
MSNARTFLNYPPAEAHDVPYRAPPAPKNPVVKGVALHYLANVYVDCNNWPSELTALALQLYRGFRICYGAMRVSHHSVISRRSSG